VAVSNELATCRIGKALNRSLGTRAATTAGHPDDVATIGGLKKPNRIFRG
jgi:hypothetical protein